jgi:hypothetical protein
MRRRVSWPGVWCMAEVVALQKPSAAEDDPRNQLRVVPHGDVSQAGRLVPAGVRGQFVPPTGAGRDHSARRSEIDFRNCFRAQPLFPPPSVLIRSSTSTPCGAGPAGSQSPRILRHASFHDGDCSWVLAPGGPGA